MAVIRNSSRFTSHLLMLNLAKERILILHIHHQLWGAQNIAKKVLYSTDSTCEPSFTTYSPGPKNSSLSREMKECCTLNVQSIQLLFVTLSHVRSFACMYQKKAGKYGAKQVLVHIYEGKAGHSHVPEHKKKPTDKQD